MPSRDISVYEDLIRSAFPDEVAIEWDQRLVPYVTEPYNRLTVTHKAYQWQVEGPSGFSFHILYRQVLEIIIRTGIVYEDNKQKAFNQIIKDIQHRLECIDPSGIDTADEIELLIEDLEDGSL